MATNHTVMLTLVSQHDYDEDHLERMLEELIKDYVYPDFEIVDLFMVTEVESE